ncbi:uncharacterized protein LOC125657564 [Ostrea edulis]|uniref:uncharacterized protein LOC125657564 n=1 Tax=Ostrea edulis TaxID=37623 RepID=UPI0024AEFE4E|nr:uncharacterized protein LOC125657564 [Ostrea edulis]
MDVVQTKPKYTRCLTYSLNGNRQLGPHPAASLRGSTPSFVSDWVNMTANSSSSSVSVDHGLGELPLRVMIEARTEEGWIFPGFGSAQADDDKDVPYGGVVFIYNEVNIQMYVPHRNNGRRIKSKWTALYLGNENKWVGPDQLPRRHTSVLVRAKAWKPRDLPPPSWRSSAILVQGDCINTTLEHTFQTYPDLIVVQVQTPLGTFQGQGLSMLRYPIGKVQHVGGLLYGVNETHVQLWSICDIDGELKFYGLWSAQDGWGTKGMGPTLTGNITIFAWDLSKIAQRITKTLNLTYLQQIDYRIPVFNVTPDAFISVQVEVLEGPNKNFRFDGLGSVMTEVEPYGGLVYAYNEVEATVGIWIPHPNKLKPKKVAVFMLGMNWGWGFKQQMTDNVNIIISSVTITGCRCPCAMVGAVPIQANETEKLQQRIRELKANLTIMKNETSKALRRKISAYDPRQSAKSLGAVLGAGILIFVFGFIIISDLPKLWFGIGRCIFILRTRNQPKNNSD